MRTLITSIALSLVVASGCAKHQTQTASSSQPAAVSPARDLSPERLGEIGAEIKKQPEKASEILSSHGLDEKTFEVAIRKVTEDPEASKRYATAFKKATT